jgi:exopolysaccharide biosynthesis predicted pyruvyltransferase EpsI
MGEHPERPRAGRHIIDLQRRLDETVAALLPPGTKAALVNYPNHHNVGDPALYLGTLATLRRNRIRVTYRCEHRTYSRRSLAQELRRGTSVILINGGGNLGDQYPQQHTRAQVLADFPGVPTIQLAQSLWFEDEANLESFAELVARHGNLTMLMRDRASYERAARTFDAEVMLCPDMACGLGPLPRPGPPSQDIVWLRRTDSTYCSFIGPRRFHRSNTCSHVIAPSSNSHRFASGSYSHGNG